VQISDGFKSPVREHFQARVFEGGQYDVGWLFVVAGSFIDGPNRYRWNRNNPLRWVDRNGLLPGAGGWDLERLHRDVVHPPATPESAAIDRAAVTAAVVLSAELVVTGYFLFPEALPALVVYGPTVMAPDAIAAIYGTAAVAAASEMVIGRGPANPNLPSGSPVAGSYRNTPNVKGAIGEELMELQLAAEGANLRGTQLTFDVPSSPGVTTRLDGVSSTPTGLFAEEAKFGASARLTANQEAARNAINAGQPLIPRGPRAKNAGFTPGVPVNLCGFRERRF
jgi:hypothetical protein